MPIPQDFGWQSPEAADERPAYPGKTRTLSEESITTGDHEGSLLDQSTDVASKGDRSHVNSTQNENICTDRAELIERIKRGESPTWVPNEAVSGNSKHLRRVSWEECLPILMSFALLIIHLRDCNWDCPRWDRSANVKLGLEAFASCHFAF